MASIGYSEWVGYSFVFLAKIVLKCLNMIMQFLSSANTYILIKTLFRSFVSLFYVLYFPYLLSFGLSNFEINLINAIFFHLVIFGLDIPTGLFADFFGKKLSAVIGFVLYSAGVFVYFIGNSFWYFAGAEFLLAVATAFISGSLLSWMIEVVGKDEFQKVEGNSEFWVSIFSFGAVSLSGLASYHFGFKPVIFLESVGIFGTAILALFLMKKDIAHHSQTKSLSSFLSSSKDAWKVAKENQLGFQVAILNSLSWVGIMAMFIFWQPIFLELGLSQQYAGVLFGCFGVAMGLGSKYIGKLKIDNPLALFSRIVFGTGIMILLSASFLQVNWLGSILFLFGFEFLVGAKMILSTSIYNQNLDDDNRAAVNSVYSAIEKIGSTIGLLCLGYLADITSREFTWFVAAGLFLLIALFGFFINSKKSSLSK